MKAGFALVLLFAVFAAVLAFPTVDNLNHNGLYLKVNEETEEAEVAQPENEASEEEVGGRFRRATCDLLSFSTKLGSINHAACAAHCLAMRKGYRGGRCKNAVCHCRR